MSFVTKCCVFLVDQQWPSVTTSREVQRSGFELCNDYRIGVSVGFIVHLCRHPSPDHPSLGHPFFLRPTTSAPALKIPPALHDKRFRL